MLYLLSSGDVNQLLLTVVNTIEIFFLLSGLSVIIAKNPIVSVLFLISLFLLMLGIKTVCALFLFILMLINIRILGLDHKTLHIMVTEFFLETILKLYIIIYVTY